jgi:hypothetical protein
MEKQNENLRERLLARMPRPEKLAAYQEETASLLAKHENALFWEKFLGVAVVWLALAVWLTVNSTWGPKLDTNGRIFFDSFAGILLFTGGITGVGYNISRAKVDLLKEVKQVQLQILELQASLNKGGEKRV